MEKNISKNAKATKPAAKSSTVKPATKKIEAIKSAQPAKPAKKELTKEEKAAERKRLDAEIVAASKAEKAKKETERKARLEAKKAEKPVKNSYSLSHALIDGCKSLKKGVTKKQIFEAADKFYQDKAKPKTNSAYSFKISDYVLPSLVLCGFLLKDEKGIYTVNPKYSAK